MPQISTREVEQVVIAVGIDTKIKIYINFTNDNPTEIRTTIKNQGQKLYMNALMDKSESLCLSFANS